MKKHLPKKIFNLSFLTKYFYSIFFLLLISIGVYGQGKGTVTGRVLDGSNDEPLLAATVVVAGTTTGTVTDRNGQYTLVLNPGTHTLQFSYIGYETVEETVTIQGGETSELNITLAPATILGEEAVITAQARGQLAAVNQQLRSNQVVNVVSSERIKELPDANAAQAISRLPGIHLDGSQVVVRGIQPKMNKILINGVEMPSTSSTSRAVSLGMISSNMLSGIEVFKTLTPDMDADAIGGVVNLTLQEAPEGLHYNVMAQGTYNAQEEIIGNYKFWGDISNRFFDNKLGASLNLNYESSNGGDDVLTPRYQRLQEGEIGTAVYFSQGYTIEDQINLNDDIGGSLVLDYKLPKGKLVFSSMYTHSENDRTSHTDYVGGERLTRELHLNRSASTTNLYNNSLAYEQQIGILKLDARVSAVAVDRTSDYDFRYRFRSETQMFNPDSLTNDKRLKMQPWEWNKYEIPDSWRNLRMYMFDWNPYQYDESQILADLNLEIPVRLSDNINATVKTGGKFKTLERSYDEQDGRYGDDVIEEPIHAVFKDYLISIGVENWQGTFNLPVVRDYDYEPRGNFLNGNEHYGMPYVVNPDLMDPMAIDLMDYSTLQRDAAEWRDDYWGGEDYYAGYLMAEINLGKRLLIIPGVRYERVDNHYKAMKIANISKGAFVIRDTLDKPATHENWLPHLHMRFSVTDWWDIRLSYNNTLSRPDYNYAVPLVFYNLVASSGVAGNPYIGPAVSENLDGNFTFFSRKLGLVTIGGFMKRIDDIFYGQPTLIKNIPDSSIMMEFPLDQYPALESGETNFYINNPNPAYLRGLEAEWQSNFSWLPSPFNGIVLNVNYTHVWSETDYPQHRVSKSFIPTPPYVLETENDTVFTNRLLHQANDIANVSLGYDYKGFSARLSFRFQGNVISSVAGRPEDNVYTNDVYKYDFAMKQRLPFKVVNMELFFNAINFTNVPYKRYSIYPNKGETNVLTRYSGREFQLGIRLTK